MLHYELKSIQLLLNHQALTDLSVSHPFYTLILEQQAEYMFISYTDLFILSVNQVTSITLSSSSRWLQYNRGAYTASPFRVIREFLCLGPDILSQTTSGLLGRGAVKPVLLRIIEDDDSHVLLKTPSSSKLNLRRSHG